MFESILNFRRSLKLRGNINKGNYRRKLNPENFKATKL